MIKVTYNDKTFTHAADFWKVEDGTLSLYKDPDNGGFFGALQDRIAQYNYWERVEFVEEEAQADFKINFNGVVQDINKITEQIQRFYDERNARY